MCLKFRNISILISTTVIIIFFGYSFAEELIKINQGSMPFLADKVNQKVQLRENEWITIVSDVYKEETLNEMMKRLEISTKVTLPTDNRLMRRLIVWVQFLKPCKATSKNDDLLEKYSGKDIPNDVLTDIFTIKNMIPEYKCDYRTTIFATFYDKSGAELNTVRSQPTAMIDQDKKYKYTILPGEKAFNIFIVPDSAAYYYSWVPK